MSKTGDARGLSRREVLGAAAGLPLLASGIPSTLPGEGERQPSYLVILADQLNWWMTDPAQRGALDLPNMDRMRAEGTSFDSCYATSPVCTAARTTMRTGLHPHRNPGGADLLPDSPRVEAALQARGYRTHYVGKWHLSPGPGTSTGFVLPKWRPNFDTFVGHEVSHTAHVTFKGEDPTPIPTGSWDAATMTDFALDRIREDAASGQPFYMQVNYLAPHDPYDDYPGYLGFYKSGDVSVRANVPFPFWDDVFGIQHHYMNATRGVDLELGRLLDEVDQLGLQVVVLFSSDHGDMLSSHGLKGKRVPYEESARIPLIVRGPGWSAGRVVRYPVGQVDWAKTLADLGQGTALEQRRDSTYFQMDQSAASWLGQKWRAIVTEDGWKLAVTENGTRLMTDLTNDPYEQNDLGGQGLAQEAALFARMREWAHETRDGFFG